MAERWKEWFWGHLTWEVGKELLKLLGIAAWAIGGWTSIETLPPQNLAKIQLVALTVFLVLALGYRRSLLRLQRPPEKRPENVLSQRTDPLPLLDFYPLRGDRPGTTYTLKLRATFQNGYLSPLELTQLRWSAHSEEVQIQPPLAYRFQVETAQGAWKRESWSEESLEVVVRPGWAFRFWVGVNPSYADDDLRQRHHAKQIGTAMISGKVGGKDCQFDVRL